jgi:hypothetical protein
LPQIRETSGGCFHALEKEIPTVKATKSTPYQ